MEGNVPVRQSYLSFKCVTFEAKSEIKEIHSYLSLQCKENKGFFAPSNALVAQVKFLVAAYHLLNAFGLQLVQDTADVIIQQQGLYQEKKNLQN